MKNIVFCLVVVASGFSALAAEFFGQYNYPLIIRDDMGFAATDRVTDICTVKVYDASGNVVNSSLRNSDLATTGCNCILEVQVSSAASKGAPIGSQLTLVMTGKGNYNVSFRSSKVLPPVGGSLGIASTTGVYFCDASDTDTNWGNWKSAMAQYSGKNIGDAAADPDGDGVSNIEEYRRGTDPLGGELGLQNTTGFEIAEKDGGYEVSFNHDWSHIYSVRVIEGDTVVGKEGKDVEMFTSKGGTSKGKFLFSEEASGRVTRYVAKPEGSYCIGLAVDGQLLDYIKVKSEPSFVSVTPGVPLSYESEEAANAAKAKAVLTPNADVVAALTEKAEQERYAGLFRTEVKKDGEKWVLQAVLTDEAETGLKTKLETAVAQIPVAQIAASGEAVSVTLTDCVPGLYYSLLVGADVRNLTPDTEVRNLNVLCGADGKVTFPAIGKPSAAAGFFRIGVKEI